MNRRRFFLQTGALASLAWLPARAAKSGPEVHVYKSPTCGCCGKWVEHLQAAGFSVKVTEVTDTAATRQRLGMPQRYASCHTATVGGYLLEGHVPAAEVRRLLAARPKALGLAAPGMPPASPGMDVPGNHDPYDVLLIGGDGQSTVFATYPKPRKA